MTIDIRFNNAPPRQFQHVRRTEVNFGFDDPSRYTFVIYFYDDLYPKMTILHKDILQVVVTND